MSPLWFRGPRNANHALRRKQERRRRFEIEPLEGRQMLSTFNVTNTNDSGTGSLRQAILSSNATTGPNTVDFDIAASGLQTIKLLSGLPALTQPVTIAGMTEPGYKTPVIVLNGSTAGSTAVGLTIASSAAGSSINGLVIDAFAGGGVLIAGGSKDTITADYIGVTATGNAPSGNGGYGIELDSQATGAVIANDVIAANAGAGIKISGAGTSGNLVEGVVIGLDVTGTIPLGNSGDGVLVQTGASQNTIGGTTASAAMSFRPTAAPASS